MFFKVYFFFKIWYFYQEELIVIWLDRNIIKELQFNILMLICQNFGMNGYIENCFV